MSRDGERAGLHPSFPGVLPPHLKILRPPAYDELVPLSPGKLGEGSIICVDAREDLPAVSQAVYEHNSPAQSYLAEIRRSCPCVLLVPNDVPDVLRALHSRPFLQGYRAVLVPGIPWLERLQEFLTDEQSLAQDLTAWILANRRARRLDPAILASIFSSTPNPSPEVGLVQPVASANTVAAHLRRLPLPPASELKTLGWAVRACMRLQRDRDTTVESVARTLGYLSDAAVGRLIKRKFDATTNEVREKLGWEWLMGRWDSRHCG
jgi:hypothetical protein